MMHFLQTEAELNVYSADKKYKEPVTTDLVDIDRGVALDCNSLHPS